MWERVWVLDPPIPYLPSLEANDDTQEMAKIYIYRRN
jgi:hypothetical protein